MKKIIFLTLLLMTCSWMMAQENVTRETYVYSVKDGESLHLDVYIDSSKVKEEPRPVMIYVHGGGFSMGSRKNVAQEIYNRFWAEQGFVSVSMDYRLGMAEGNTYNAKTVEEVIRLANVDMVDATNFLLNNKDKFNIDPASIMISGGSAGAMACLTIEHDICNNLDYTRALPEGFNYAGVISHAGAVIMNGESLTWEKKPCPIFFMHGDNDIIVPLEQNNLWNLTWVGPMYMHQQFKEMNVPHWVYIEEGADHVIAMKALTNNNAEQERFFETFVKGKSNSKVLTKWADAEPSGMGSVEAMLQHVPMYILGFGKYMEEMAYSNLEAPQTIVY